VAELASFSETSRQRAFERFELLRAHIEDGRPLAAIARETKLSHRTLTYWLERYQTSGLAALARKPRSDRGRRRKLSVALQKVIEGKSCKLIPKSHTWKNFKLLNCFFALLSYGRLVSNFVKIGMNYKYRIKR